MSGLPDIGAGHDREDFLFREDLVHLFDGSLKGLSQHLIR
jgi:hypothetical protein